MEGSYDNVRRSKTGSSLTQASGSRRTSSFLYDIDESTSPLPWLPADDMPPFPVDDDDVIVHESGNNEFVPTQLEA